MTGSRNIILTLILLLEILISGCFKNITWVPEPPEFASCVPDAPPTWKNYTAKDWDSAHSAQTAVQFVILSRDPPRLQARFDGAKSFVKPNVVEAWFPYEQELRQHLLRHEQLHFAISCLLTRQANTANLTGIDLEKMLRLLRATAQRLNLQYDKDTNHGTIQARQAQWEADVAQQLQSIASLKSSLPNNSTGAESQYEF